MRMKKNLVRVLQVVGVVIIVLIVTYSSIAVWLYSSSGRFPLKSTPLPPVRIRDLVWPTIGYPALATPGSVLEAEFDFNPGVAAGAPVERPSGWSAELTPSRAELRSLTYRLKLTRAWKDISSKWPRGSDRGTPYKVWHAQFQIPGDAVPELYDLSVGAEAAGKKFKDSQRHAVSLSLRITDSFRFVTLADIHVHERNISGVFQNQTNKGITPEGRPVFFENAIDQVNLIRPDFVVLLGDFVYAQHASGEYQIEFENFFNALKRFDVPVFTVPGNHDEYINEVDGAEVWQQTFGPLFYSFDVADCHFTVANTSEWPNSDRIVMSKLGLFVYPRKWKGEVLFATDEKNVDTYAGQLAWLRDDLAAHLRSRLRIMLVHHDPYSPDGEGESWKNDRFLGVFTMGGGGKGRTALEQLASTYRVNVMFSGHIHKDNVGSILWSGLQTSSTVYANQTCAYFDEGGVQVDQYPGYRLVDVRGGKVQGFTYLNDKSSIPFYAGTVPGGENNLDLLHTQALSALRFAAAGQAAGAAGVTPGATAAQRGWLVKNYLGISMDLRGLVMEAPVSNTGYTAGGGEVYRSVKIPGTSRVLLFVRVNIAKGVPGSSGARPGTPRQAKVTVQAQVPARPAAAAAVPSLWR